MLWIRAAVVLVIFIGFFFGLAFVVYITPESVKSLVAVVSNIIKYRC